ncbi:hypothetical protein ANCCEY_06713 [Ancylostoma ceylanicum]|uniref:Reverse transcriptase domain-containing protein n=1 Tax=Ancylostoma ceylanicum TaxID=53326 RepID=A0A0D6LQQ1_9BILA|nr:hypothetical protein ANCCEY_06713 [Ancylostoma ceylanicum]
MVELEEAASEVPFDIIGLSGAQQTGSSVLRLQRSAHTIFLSDSTGFLVDKRRTDCCSFYTVSERASFINVRMVTGYLRVIQVYAATTAHTDDEFDEFLDHVTEALNTRSSASPRKECTKIVIGDFNAKIGCGNAEEQFIGPYGFGVRNRRGNTFAHFCCETHLHVVNNRGRIIRKAFHTNKTHTKPLKQLKKNDGTIAGTSDVKAVVQGLFNNLFSLTGPSLPQVLQCSENLPPILPREVRNALSKMKVGKAPGPDPITVEMLISGYHVLEEHSTKLFNKCLEREHLPASLADSVISLLFKKGDPLDIGNFRPIALLSTVYKLFRFILAHRMLNCLDVNQPVEQAGFRRKYSTVDQSM